MNSPLQTPSSEAPAAPAGSAAVEPAKTPPPAAKVPSAWKRLMAFLGWTAGAAGLSRSVMGAAFFWTVCLLILGNCLFAFWLWHSMPPEHSEGRPLHTPAGHMASLASLMAQAGQWADPELLTRLAAWHQQAQANHRGTLSLQVTSSNGQSLLALPLAPVPGPGPEQSKSASVNSGSSVASASAAQRSLSWPLARLSQTAAAPVNWTLTLELPTEDARPTLIGLLLTSALISTGCAVLLLALLGIATRKALMPISELIQAARRLARGDRETLRRMPRPANNDMAGLVKTLLRQEEQVAAAEQARRHMAQQIITLQEDERQHMAAELHDELGQHLTALRVDLAWLGQKLGPASDAAEVVKGMDSQLSRLQTLVRDLLKRLRPLRPSQDGDDVNLQVVAPLQALVEAWNQSSREGTRFSLTLSATTARGDAVTWENCHPGRLKDDLALVLYRISQEALTNAARHSGATRAWLVLHWRPAPQGAGGTLDWSACDNGCGVASLQKAMQRGTGLSGIQARIWSHGAELSMARMVQSPVHPGLRLQARFHLGSEDAAHDEFTRDTVPGELEGE